MSESAQRGTIGKRIMHGVMAALLLLSLTLPTHKAAGQVGDETTPTQIAQPFDQSAVLVKSGTGHGSGVYLGNGYVLTAGHVAKIAKTFTVEHPRSETYSDTWSADTLWVDEARDIGLLKVKAVITDSALPTATLRCEPLKLSQNVTIVGWPADLGRISSRGYVGGEMTKRYDWLESNVVIAPVYFGNSGGPVYNDAGEVVALATGIIQGTSLSIVVPVKSVCDVLPKTVKIAP